MGMYGYDESDEAVELFLFAQNDRDLYRQQTLPIIENLKKKIAKGKYDKTLAVKLWRYLADNAAKKYTFEHGTTSARTWQTVKGFGVFTVAMRNGAARLLEDYYASEALGLRQENPKRRKRSTPIKRTNISKRKYVSRPSQITGDAPTRRLKKRRTLAESGPAGYFPNPAKKKPAPKDFRYLAQVLGTDKKWRTMAGFNVDSDCDNYVVAMHKQYPNFSHRSHDTKK